MNEEQPGSGSAAPDWNEAKAKLTGATGADRMILVAGLVFVVSTFLPWFGASAGGFSSSVSGWSSGGLGLLAVLFGFAATAFAVIRVLGMKITLPMEDKMLYLVLGAGAFAFTLIRMLTYPKGGAGILGISIGPKWGIFVALVAAVGLAWGGLQKKNA